MNLTEPVRHTLDVGSVAAVIASLAGILPPIAALLSIIWLTIQIVDFFKRQRAKTRSLRRRSTDQ